MVEQEKGKYIFIIYNVYSIIKKLIQEEIKGTHIKQ